MIFLLEIFWNLEKLLIVKYYFKLLTIWNLRYVQMLNIKFYIWHTLFLYNKNIVIEKKNGIKAHIRHISLKYRTLCNSLFIYRDCTIVLSLNISFFSKKHNYSCCTYIINERRFINKVNLRFKLKVKLIAFYYSK